MAIRREGKGKPNVLQDIYCKIENLCLMEKTISPLKTISKCQKDMSARKLQVSEKAKKSKNAGEEMKESNNCSV